jgi:hypothetical protein
VYLPGKCKSKARLHEHEAYGHDTDLWRSMLTINSVSIGHNAGYFTGLALLQLEGDEKKNRK